MMANTWSRSSPSPNLTSRKLLFLLSPKIADLPISGIVPDAVFCLLSTYQYFRCLNSEQGCYQLPTLVLKRGEHDKENNDSEC